MFRFDQQNGLERNRTEQNIDDAVVPNIDDAVVQNIDDAEQNIDDAVVPVLDIQSCPSLFLLSFLVQLFQQVKKHKHIITIIRSYRSFPKLSSHLTKKHSPQEQTPDQPTNQPLPPTNQVTKKKKEKMGCGPSRPSPPRPTARPPPRRQGQAQRPQPHKPTNTSRLSRPFDPNIPLYAPQPNSLHRAKKPAPRPFDAARYGDAYAQLTAGSKRAQAPRGRR